MNKREIFIAMELKDKRSFHPGSPDSGNIPLKLDEMQEVLLEMQRRFPRFVNRRNEKQLGKFALIIRKKKFILHSSVMTAIDATKLLTPSLRSGNNSIAGANSLLNLSLGA